MTKRILVINAGSSSLKFAAYAADREPRLELRGNSRASARAKPGWPSPMPAGARWIGARLMRWDTTAMR